MKLNYDLGNNLSLEGVYELRTSEDGEENINANSLGGDIKYLWTFR